MSAPLTQALGAFVASPGFDAVPQDVLPTVRNGFIDTLACLLSDVRNLSPAPPSRWPASAAH